MTEEQDPSSLGQLLDRIEAAASKEGRVTLGAILDSVGRRSFAPLLLLAGLVTLAPVIGDIPGMPTIMALLVLLTAGQLLIGREHFWLPQWLLARSVTQQSLCKALRWMRPPARFLDRFSRRRLTVFANNGGLYVTAVACILIALAMPVMEVIPFSANGAGAALTAFGLALIARDGALALFALAIMIATAGFLVWGIL